MAKINPWNMGGYKAGQNVVCKIVKAEQGGYSVLVVKDNFPGYVESKMPYTTGQEVLLVYKAKGNKGFIFAERFQTQQSSTTMQVPQQVDWQAQAMSGENPPNTTSWASPPGQGQFPVDNQGQTSGQFQAAQGQSEQDFQNGWGASHEEQAFANYGSGQTIRRFRLQRAIDLIMPPVHGNGNLQNLRIGDYDVEWLITDLEGGMRTGCVKAVCESRLSRSAMLLYKGRAVGCIYGSKSDPTDKPTEVALQAMLADLESPDTVVTIYDLPQDISLSMSSTFLGYPVQPQPNLTPTQYLEFILDWFSKQGGIATIAAQLTTGLCLGYIYEGKYRGAFYVETQEFNEEIDFLYQLVASDSDPMLAVSILPNEMHSNAVRFGYSLSMSRKNRKEY